MNLNCPKLQFLAVDGVDIAVRYREGRRMPGMVWLGGYYSNMLGTKAQRLDEIAQQIGTPCLRFDYSGHGESKGDFYQGTLSQWLKESLAVFDHFTRGPQILVGSSMGGWIALRMAQELKQRGTPLMGLILLAPAPDFTKDLVIPAMSAEQKQRLETQGFFTIPSDHSNTATPFTKRFLDDGENNIVMHGIIDLDCPVHILQGMQDKEVPFQHTLSLMHHLPLHNVTLCLIHDGDHGLSRPQDLDLLENAINRMIS